MYFLIKGICKDDEGGTFEWVINAESKDSALAELNDTDEVLEVREISVEERIEREEREIADNIKNEYLINHYGESPLRDYVKKQDQMQTNSEMYYDALLEHNKIMRFKRRLLRSINKDALTVAQFDNALKALCSAKSDEEFNAILANAQDL